jgi:hypothetical protein
MNPSQFGKEKRDSPRIPKEVSVEINNLAYPLPEKPREEGASKNIGKGGIGFTVSSPYEPKAVLSLKIYLKGWQHHKKNVSAIIDGSAATAPLTAIAEVVWSKKLKDDPRFEVGAKFLDIYEDDYVAFKKHLGNIVKI